jgi:hypothetical protein
VGGWKAANQSIEIIRRCAETAATVIDSMNINDWPKGTAVGGQWVEVKWVLASIDVPSSSTWSSTANSV